RDPAGARAGAQLRHRSPAVHRLRRLDRRRGDDHRLAPQRHPRALYPADVRGRHVVLRLAAGRQALHAGLPATRLSAVPAPPVPRRHRRDPGGRRYFDEEYRKLGPVSQGETVVLAVFAVTAVLWVASPLLKPIVIAGMKPLAALSDTGIAML